MLIQHLHRPDAVDAVDRREQVVGVVEVGLVLQKRRQVEVILGEHDAHRLHPALHQFRFFHALIPDLNDPLIADGLPQLPQAAQHALPVVGRNVVQLLVGHQFPHGLLALLRHGAVDELVQYAAHVLGGQGAALQQNFAHR